MQGKLIAVAFTLCTYGNQLKALNFDNSHNYSFL